MKAPFHLLGLLWLVTSASAERKPPNVVVVIADQWRAQAFGFAGDENAKTPHFDRLAAESRRFTHAISSVAVCSPARASMLTGQHALTHGVFINDVPLDPAAPTLAKVFKSAGYATAAIGKWHVDGHGRASFIPPERHQGFDYWKVLECTHSYTDSIFYGDTPEKQRWGGYDALEQTHDACAYLRAHRDGPPVLLWLAWGPPHDPYLTAPPQYRALYDPAALKLRPNVPPEMVDYTRQNLAGYYAHGSALDDAMGELLATLQETGLADNTILVFTADHGDMLGSQGMMKKQKPYDESIRVPLLVRWPDRWGHAGSIDDRPFATEDLMPTLLGLCGLPIPTTVEGSNMASPEAGAGAVLISCPSPFGEWDRRHGGKEYRGLRTQRHTYVRDLQGPWLLFDNEADPFQMHNLANDPAAAALQAEMEARLQKMLAARGDRFRPGGEYIAQWKYQVNASGTAPTAP